MGYKMLAVDLDGTLLDENHQLTQRVRTALYQVAESGVQIVIATGRMFQSAVKIVDEIGMDLPMVTYNGALIRSGLSGRIYDHHKLDAVSARMFVALLRGQGLEPLVYIEDELYVEAQTERTRAYAEITKVRLNYVGNLEAYITEEPTMLLFMGDVLTIDNLLPKMQQTYGQEYYITRSFPTFIEIMKVGVSKAAALESLAAELEISREEIIAIGDNYNDIEMITYAGLGVAVGNAAESLKCVADYTAQARNGEAVIEVIERFIINN